MLLRDLLTRKQATVRRIMKHLKLNLFSCVVVAAFSSLFLVSGVAEVVLLSISTCVRLSVVCEEGVLVCREGLDEAVLCCDTLRYPSPGAVQFALSNCNFMTYLHV